VAAVFAPRPEIAIIKPKASGADMTNELHENLTLGVPIEVLFENLADGMSIDESLDQYQTLDRDDVLHVLELTSVTPACPRAA